MLFGCIILFLCIIEKTFPHRLFCHRKVYFIRVSVIGQCPGKQILRWRLPIRGLQGRVLGTNTCKRAMEAGTGWGRDWMVKDLQRRTQPIPQGTLKLGKLFGTMAVPLYSHSTFAMTNPSLWAASGLRMFSCVRQQPLSKGSSWGRLRREPLAIKAPDSWMNVSVLERGIRAVHWSISYKQAR